MVTNGVSEVRPRRLKFKSASEGSTTYNEDYGDSLLTVVCYQTDKQWNQL